MNRVLHEQMIRGIVHDLKLSEPILFVDNEKKGRSGHAGHALATFDEGKIIDFHANTSGIRLGGHSGFGWMEYQISEDFGESFGPSQKFPYSWDTFLDGYWAVAIEKVVSPKKNVLVAFCTLLSQMREPCYEPYGIPNVLRSEDGGKTWSPAFRLCERRGRVFDALYIQGSIFVLEFCNDSEESFFGNKPEHQYRIYKSDDDGRTFYEHCVVPFPDTTGRSYGNMIVTPESKLIVYTYNVNDQNNMDYAISSDGGKTWDSTGLSFVAKQIRNPQVGLLDGQFILHGRAGESETGHGAFVLYTSKDGIVWDEGTILIDDKSACFYSNNLTVTGADGKERMLVQYSENVKDPGTPWSGQVNVMHFWLESMK